MKSKSLSALSNTSITTQEQNRTFDFVNLYKSASETGSSLSTIPQTSDASSHKVKSESPKRERSPNKRKKVAKRESIDVSLITIDGPELSNVASSTPRNEGKATSTPLIKRKLQDKASKVKSIMKTSTVIPGDSVDVSYADTSTSKSKKRNKSVSFNLGEEVASKKIKSDESTNESKSDTTEKTKAKRQFKKIKKNRLAEKENKIEVNQQTKENEDFVKEKPQKKLKTKVENPQITLVAPLTGETQNTQTENGVEIKKKRKNQKKLKKPDEGINVIGDQNATQEVTEKVKKAKKKKHQEKANEPENEEPASKSRKKDLKPDVVTELENLSIGDNAHTLSNMLDEMTVVDKEKRKKLKQQFKKNKKSKGSKVESTQDSDKTEDEKEKVKWSRRKWNKDGKADAKELNLDTTIIVENLPLSMLFSYKKVLAEHFVKYGLIKSVGIAEVYPTEESKPVFTTTVMFYSDGAATLAMDDTSEFEGSRVKVRRPRPPAETTLVVRSYGPLTTQAVSSMFAGAGRLRNIRHLVKGKHAMSTYFVELDGPESVERGLKQAADAKAGGKKVYISRFEVRTKTPKQKAKDTDGSDADQSDDSQG